MSPHRMEEYYQKQLSEIYERAATESDGMLVSDTVGTKKSTARDIALNHKFRDAKYPANVVKTQKYNWFTFLFLSILE